MTRVKTKECFIIDAQQIHQNYYDYSFVEYINNRTKVKIKCPIHGFFEQKPNDHLGYHGCPNCGGVGRKTTENFILESKKIHNETYCYDFVEYKNAHSKVKIRCFFHGIFYQEPNVHLKGHGCPKCNHRISENEEIWLNKLKVPIRQYKIKINGKKVQEVDGYNSKTNTIYEFLGDYWHGGPLFSRDDINHKNKKNMTTLHKLTMERFKNFKNMGYNIIYIWESDFKNGKEPIYL